MLQDVKISKDFIVTNKDSLNGSQTKYYKDNVWYKVNRLGNLDKQICLESPKAFSRLDEVYRYKCSVKDFQRFINRDKKARDDYRVLRKNNPIRGTYIRNILISEGLC